MPLQAAAHTQPRRFTAVQVFRFRDDPPPRVARQRVARLMAAVEDHPHPDTEILVGLRVRFLRGLLEDDEQLGRNVIPHVPGRMRPTPGHVLVQVSSETENGRLFGLRLAEGCLEAAAVESEVLSIHTLGAREPFGYHDGDYGEVTAARPAPESVRSPAGPFSFLLHQRWVQDVAGFFAQPAAAQDRTVGKDRDGNELEGEDSHVRTAGRAGRGDRSPLLRRGFRYRQGGEEGVVFLALAAVPEVFEASLQRMLGGGGDAPDPMLEFAEAVEGGVYLVPTTASWLTDGAAPAAGPLPAPAEDVRLDNELLLYELVPAARAYMLHLRDRILEVDAEADARLSPDIQPLVDALHWRLAGGIVHTERSGSADAAAVEQLETMLREAFDQANAVNAEHGYYVTANF